MRKLKMHLVGITCSVMSLSIGFIAMLPQKQDTLMFLAVPMFLLGIIGVVATTINLARITRRIDFFYYLMASLCLGSLLPFWYEGWKRHDLPQAIYVPITLSVITLILSYRRMTQDQQIRAELTPTVH